MGWPDSINNQPQDINASPHSSVGACSLTPTTQQWAKHVLQKMNSCEQKPARLRSVCEEELLDFLFEHQWMLEEMAEGENVR